MKQFVPWTSVLSMKRSLCGSCAAAVMTMAAPVAHAQPELIALGLLPGGEYAGVGALSADGQAVAGTGDDGGSGFRAFRWTSAGSLQNLGVLDPSSFGAQGLGISGDGSVVAGVAFVGFLNVSQAFRWTAVAGMQNLGTLPGHSAASATAVSADGLTIVGSSGPSGSVRAFRWTASGGMHSLGTLPGGTSSSGYGVSENGSVIVGIASTPSAARAFRWTLMEGMQDLGTLPGTNLSSARAVSADGSTIVGSCTIFSPSGARAFRWTEESGMQDLGSIVGTWSVYEALAVSANGSVIGGQARGGTNTAFLWTSALGMVELNTYLPTVGVDLTSWTLTSVSGVSADGSTIAGTGLFNGELQPWVVTGLSTQVPCLADYNGDTEVDVLDFLDFFADFGDCENQPAPCGSLFNADVNGDTLIDVLDFLDFLDAFGQGC